MTFCCSEFFKTLLSCVSDMISAKIRTRKTILKLIPPWIDKCINESHGKNSKPMSGASFSIIVVEKVIFHQYKYHMSMWVKIN